MTDRKRPDEVPESGGEERGFLSDLLFSFVPSRIKEMIRRPAFYKLDQFAMLFILTTAVGLGYLYGMARW